MRKGQVEGDTSSDNVMSTMIDLERRVELDDPNLSGGQPSVPFNRVGGSRMTIAYAGVFAFILIYFLAPGLWVPGLRSIPFAKIAGGVALAAFILGYVASTNRKLPKETKALIFLFIQLCLAIPFGYWRTGSMQVVLPLDGFFGITMMAIAITFAVTTLPRLVWLIFLQTIMLAVFAFIAVTNKNYSVDMAQLGRLEGVLNGLFVDSNDFAMGMAMVVPFLFLFHFSSRNVFVKLFCMGTLGVLTYGIMATYSRGGFLAFAVVLLFCVREFGLKQRRYILPVTLAVAFFVLIIVTPSYQLRLKSIVDPSLDESGSRAQRTYLLKRSIDVTLHNPVLGIGPGNFAAVSGIWHVAHNNYTQLSSEAGIPALIIFLLLMKYTFATLRSVQQCGIPRYSLLATGLKGSLIGFLVGGCFLSTVYTFGPYFLVAYSAALGRIAQAEHLVGTVPTPKEEPGSAGLELNRALGG